MVPSPAKSREFLGIQSKGIILIWHTETQWFLNYVILHLKIESVNQIWKKSVRKFCIGLMHDSQKILETPNFCNVEFQYE